jgi:hypothetical protein
MVLIIPCFALIIQKIKCEECTHSSHKASIWTLPLMPFYVHHSGASWEMLSLHRRPFYVRAPKLGLAAGVPWDLQLPLMTEQWNHH